MAAEYYFSQIERLLGVQDTQSSEKKGRKIQCEINKKNSSCKDTLANLNLLNGQINTQNFFQLPSQKNTMKRKKRVGMSANNNLLTLKGESAQNIYVLYSVKDTSKITSTNITAAMMPCGSLQ